MPEHQAHSATTDGVTIGPAFDLVAENAQVPAQYSPIDLRVLQLCGVATGLGVAAAFVAQALIKTIALTTNLAFFGRFSLRDVNPADAADRLGLWVVVIPIVGGLIVGLMARFGSKAIRGHGIPEAMERILVNQSRIPARITFLKPLSAAIAIGTGGPFGAEGPIIATGSALGSMFGQIISTTVTERKTLLAAGAAAGMAATFGSPVAAVLLAIELLLFEYRPRSIIPVALAASAAAGMRILLVGMEPMFPMTDLKPPGEIALVTYILLGGVMGLAAVVVTRVLYKIEDWFDLLPIHWMWWPALGGIAVGVIGWVEPNTLGIGYRNIDNFLAGKGALSAVLLLCALKFVSWAVSLGSGTSGGTMAPLFTVGAGLGAAIGGAVNSLAPGLGVDVRVAALVGMASLFAGAARAMLACAVFAFETTLQPFGLLPLLGGCAASYLVSSLLMRNSMMTEKIARRGIRAPAEYVADVLDQVLVRDVASGNVVSFNARDSVGTVRAWLASGAGGATHQGFPLLNEHGVLVGLLTRRDLLNPEAKDDQELSSLVQRTLKFVYDDCTVRQAANHMVNHHIGRLPVVRRSNPREVVGIVTRSDVLSVLGRHVDDSERQGATFGWPASWRRSKPPIGS